MSVAELKLHLRLNNGNVEDTLLADMIDSAQQLFERLTGRYCVTQTVRQYVDAWPNPITLMRGQVQTINGVWYYDDDANTVEVEDYIADTVSCPGRIWLDVTPDLPTTLRPAGYVEYVCGFDTVPALVVTAVKLLAAHYYAHREAYTDNFLQDMPMGFKAVVNQFKTGLVGAWDM